MLTGRAVADFSDTAFDFIVQHEGYVRTVYLDVGGLPTVGVGYALIVKNSLGVHSVRGTLDSDFSGIHSFTAAEDDLLDNIVSALNGQDPELAKTLFDGKSVGVLDFLLSTDVNDDGRQLYDAVINQIVSVIPSGIRNGLAGTSELVALYSSSVKNL